MNAEFPQRLELVNRSVVLVIVSLRHVRSVETPRTLVYSKLWITTRHSTAHLLSTTYIYNVENYFFYFPADMIVSESWLGTTGFHPNVPPGQSVSSVRQRKDWGLSVPASQCRAGRAVQLCVSPRAFLELLTLRHAFNIFRQLSERCRSELWAG